VPTLKGISVDAGGVCGMHSLSKLNRLFYLEKTHREQTIEFNDEQTHLLEHFGPEFHERYIEVLYTEKLVTVDTFFISKLKGLVRCICKPCWTATAATPGDGSTLALFPKSMRLEWN
jgi:hypothetical protein